MIIRQAIFTSELRERIYDKFSRHSIAQTGYDGMEEDPVVFELLNENVLVGCIVLQMFWGQLHIKYLIVEECFRGHGIGRKLMEHAFVYGRGRGCTFAFVETLSFQAPEFYQRLGFTMNFTRHGYEKGISFHYLQKDLKSV